MLFWTYSTLLLSIQIIPQHTSTSYPAMSTTTASVQRKVEPALESDFPHLVNIWYDAWPGEQARAMLPDKPGGRRWVRESFEGFLVPPIGAGRDTKLLVSRDSEG